MIDRARLLARLSAALPGGVLLLSAAGCASMRACQAETTKWQSLADQATTQLHASPVAVHVIAGAHGAYTCVEQRIDLATDQPDGNTRWVLAHELGHHLNHDCGGGLGQEMRADLAAVRVFQAWGFTETQAALEVANKLWRTVKNSGRYSRPGHDVCAELVAVLRAYPILTHPTDGTCAAELAR